MKGRRSLRRCWNRLTAQNFTTRAKLAVQNMVQKVGFFGIPGCASKLFVIITLSKDIVEQMVSFTGLYNWHLPK